MHVIGLACDMDLSDADKWLAAERPMADMAFGMIIANMPGWDKSYGVDKERAWFSHGKKATFLLDAVDWTAGLLV